MVTQSRWTFQQDLGFDLQQPCSSWLAAWLREHQLAQDEVLDRLTPEWFEDILSRSHLSQHDQMIGLYLAGRVLIDEKRWEDALSCFDNCLSLVTGQDLELLIHIRYFQAFSAHQALHYRQALHSYDRFLELWMEVDPTLQASCLKEDSIAFFCNILRLKSQVLQKLGLYKQARNLLEKHAIPLLKEHFSLPPTPLDQPASSQSETNWRYLRLYLPWSLAFVVRSQVWLAPEPLLFEEDLVDAEQELLLAIHDGSIMAEGQNWLSSLRTVLAENMIQRCRVTRQTPVRDVLCQMARELLETADKPNLDLQKPIDDQLQAMVLLLPWYELAWCDRLAAGALHDGSTLIRQIKTLETIALGGSDPGFQVLAARYSWLCGTIESDRVAVDATAYKRAKSHFLHALQLISKASSVDTLLVQSIEADLRRLEGYRGLPLVPSRSCKHIVQWRTRSHRQRRNQP